MESEGNKIKLNFIILDSQSTWDIQHIINTKEMDFQSLQKRSSIENKKAIKKFDI